MLQEQASTETSEEMYVPNVIFTLNAAKKTKELMEEEGDLKLKLRISIEGGGCSGFQYIFKFEKDIQKDDIVISTRVNEDDEDDSAGKTAQGSQGGGRINIVELIIDPGSMMYLENAEIDYEDSIEGGQFVIHNPNAQTTCGCGSSFSA